MYWYILPPRSPTSPFCVRWYYGNLPSPSSSHAAPPASSSAKLFAAPPASVSKNRKPENDLVENLNTTQLPDSLSGPGPQLSANGLSLVQVQVDFPPLTIKKWGHVFKNVRASVILWFRRPHAPVEDVHLGERPANASRRGRVGGRGGPSLHSSGKNGWCTVRSRGSHETLATPDHS